ncbi:MAG: LegC family aminotransferase [Bacillota bacterium]|nr:LegC family aminotransferase [Bacillota bacterium]
MKNIPLSIPNFNGNEKKYVLDAVEAGWVSTGGAYITKFEEDISKYLKTEMAVACQSGTAAIHLAMILAGVEKDTHVIAPTLTFIAAVNPIKYCGAEPIFMDSNDSLCMDIIKLEAFLENECEKREEGLFFIKTGKRISAIITVHIFGNMTDMESLMKLSEEYEIPVIEDATEALGSYYLSGEYKGKYAGTIADFGCYSFNGNKIITTGGGGMLVAKDIHMAKKAKFLSTQAKTDELFYIHDEIGYNYRMTNLQAALGCAQLEQLERFIRVKERNYYRYKDTIDKINGLRLMEYRQDIRPNYWFYSLYIEKEYKRDRDEMMYYLKQHNIQTRPIWDLIHKQKPYMNCFTYDLETSYELQERILNIPCSSNLSEDDTDIVLSYL